MNDKIEDCSIANNRPIEIILQSTPSCSKFKTVIKQAIGKQSNKMNNNTAIVGLYSSSNNNNYHQIADLLSCDEEREDNSLDGDGRSVTSIAEKEKDLTMSSDLKCENNDQEQRMINQNHHHQHLIHQQQSLPSITAQSMSARTPKCARCRNHGLVSMLRVSIQYQLNNNFFLIKVIKDTF